MLQAPPPVRVGGLIAALPFWLAAGIGVVVTTVGVVMRSLLNRPLSLEFEEAFQELVGWLLVAAMVGGLFCAVQGILAPAGPNATRQRTPLAIWPGIIASAVVLAVSNGLLSIYFPDLFRTPIFFFHIAVRPAFFDYSALTAPVLFAAAAAVSAGRPRGAVASLAGPALVAMLWSFLINVSAAKAMLGASLFMVPIALSLVIAGAVTGRSALFWPAAGAGLVPLMGLLLLPGLFTPNELAAVLSLLAVGGGLTLNFVVHGRRVLDLFAAAAAEYGAVALAIVATLSSMHALTLIGFSQRISAALGGLPPGALLVGFAVAMFIVCYAVGPVIGVGIAILTSPAMQSVGIDPHIVPTIAILGVRRLRCSRARRCSPTIPGARAMVSTTPGRRLDWRRHLRAHDVSRDRRLAGHRRPSRAATL